MLLTFAPATPSQLLLDTGRLVEIHWSDECQTVQRLLDGTLTPRSMPKMDKKVVQAVAGNNHGVALLEGNMTLQSW
jgi:hypothetical protein